MVEYPDTSLKENLFGIGGYALFLSSLLVLAFIGLFAGGGLTEELDKTKFMVYFPLFLAFFVIATIFKFLHSFNILRLFQVMVHDPELGYISRIPFFKSGLKVLFLSIFVFSLVALVFSFAPQSAISQNVFPIGTGAELQQTTKVGQISIGALASPAENGVLWIFFALLLMIEGFIINKIYKNINYKIFYSIFIIPNIILGSIFWRLLHTLVTGADKVAQFKHFVFGGILSSLTLVTGSIFPAEVYHLTNNLFIEIQRLYGKFASVTVFFVLVLLSATILGVL